MNMKISTLAVAALFSLAAVTANANNTVTYNGFNYLLNVQRMTYTGNEAQIQNTPWWGNESLSLALSGLYKPSGYPEFTTFYFAYEERVTPTIRLMANSALNYPSGWASSPRNAIPFTNAVDYVFATSVTAAVPEADTSAMLLMGAGVMGFMARRRKQVAV
jgi:hypothetical protein